MEYRICSRVGIKSFRSEFEKIEAPTYYTIREEIKKSWAVFLLIGEKLAEYQQDSTRHDWWKHIQNWIAFEIGVACAFDIDV